MAKPFSVYERANGIFYAQFPISCGRYFQKSTGARTKADAERVVLSWYVQGGVIPAHAGANNTLLCYGIYIAVLWLYKLLGVTWQYDYLVATAISFIISVFWSFCWNRHFVFKAAEKSSFWKSLLKTYISYSFTGLFLSSALNWLWIDVAGLSKMIAPLINLCITVPLNFVLNKFWAFR